MESQCVSKVNLSGLFVIIVIVRVQLFVIARVQLW